VGGPEDDLRLGRSVHAAAAEISFSSLIVTRTGFERWSFTDPATGTVYRRMEYEPSLSPIPPDIVAFTVADGGRLHFLRERGGELLPYAVGERIGHRTATIVPQSRRRTPGRFGSSSPRTG
jgi:hypothetical protein